MLFIRKSIKFIWQDVHYGYFSLSRGKWQVVLPFYNHRRIPEAQCVSSVISENVYTAVPKSTYGILSKSEKNSRMTQVTRIVRVLLGNRWYPPAD